jgi:hypothetical protein
MCGGIVIAPGASIVWTNASAENWHAAQNWSPNQVPSGADDVSITNAGTYVVAIHSPAAARSITLGGGSGVQTLHMPGAPLVVSNSFSIGPSGVLQALGTLIVFGDVVVSGEFKASSLVLGGSGVLDVTGGQLKVLGLRVSDRLVRNRGTVLISDGHQLFLGDNTAFTNFASGTLIFTNNNSGIQYNGNFLNTNQFFANEGVVRAHGNSFIDVHSVHRGTIEVVAGQLSLRRHSGYTSFALDVTAACNIAAGATLAFENASTEFRPPASANGAGSLRVSGGSFNLTGAYSLGGTLTCHNGALVSLDTGSPLTLPHVVNESMGDLRGSDPLTITGTLQWSNGGKFSGPAPLILAATCRTTFERSITEMHRPFMVNAGTMHWIAADLVLGTNSVFTNLPAATIVMTNNEFSTVTYIRPFDGLSAFYNAGLIRVVSETPTECNIPFFNTGTVRIERNEFRLTFNSTFEQHAGATELAGGALRFFPGSNYRLFGGFLTGNGNVIGDDVESFGGIISPGTSPGQINFNQSLSLNPAGVMNIELGGTNAVTGFDQVTVGGTAVLSGGVLNVALANNFTPAVGMKFPFLNCAIRSGTFQSVSYPSNQVTLRLNYLPNGAELEVLQVASSLQVSPLNRTLRSGETQTFSASGGTPPYSFALIQNHSGATISSSGLYTAGPLGGIDLLRVTDAANANAQATTVVIPFDLVIFATTPQNFLNLLTSIEGSVIMSNIDARATLLIPGLTSVGHDLVVRDNDQLATLTLGALQTVGGTIHISGNPALTNIALPVLPNVAGSVSIDNNGSLTSIDIGNATSIGGSVSIDNNGSLTSIDLGSATTIGGSVSIDDNGALTSIDLGSVTNIVGSVDVTGNTVATNIELGSLTSAGSVDVTGNIAATNISLGLLTSTVGSVDVTGNTAATNIELGALTGAGSVNVSENASATTIDLGSLTNSAGSVNVSSNATATTIDLSSLDTVGGTVSIDGNTSTTTISLSSLDTVDGNVSIDGNTSTTTIDLSSLDTVGGTVSIDHNTSSTSIDLSTLTVVGDSVEVSHNTSASSIDLASLTIVGGNVTISDNTAASSIDLGSLTTAGGDHRKRQRFDDLA